MGVPRGGGHSAAGGVHSTSVMHGAGCSAVVELLAVVVVEDCVKDLRVGMGARRPGLEAGTRDVHRDPTEIQQGRVAQAPAVR